jgi:hypothetical protein
MVPDLHNLRIIELKCENYMRLKAVRIRPDGSLVQITGKNGAGKSSVLSVIADALGVKEWMPAVPIRKGERQGALYLDLGELRITKIFTATEGGGHDSRLVFEYKDGSRPRAPQKVLDTLRGHLVDPLAFIRAKDSERMAMVQGLFPHFNFADYAKSRKDAYDERRLLRRQFKSAHAAVLELRQALPPGKRPEPIDLSAAAEAIARANAANQERQARARRRDEAADSIERLLNEAEMLRSQAADKERQAAELQAKLDSAAPLPELIDTAKLEADLARGASLASVIKQFDEIERLDQNATGLADEVERLSAVIEELDAARTQAMSGRLPYPGLCVACDEDGNMHLALNDLPFSQASQAEHIKAATAVAIKMAPRIPVLLIRDGSLLDRDSQAMITHIAEENGFQVWLEVLESLGGKGGILIEDGEVKNAQAAPAS